MRMLWMWILLLCAPAWADISREISQACRRDPRFYRACLSNLENQYRPGYRAYDLFAYLEKPGALTLKKSAGPLFETGFPLDLALEGPGYFALSDGRLLRSGAFCLRGGQLCTEHGQRVLDADLRPTASLERLAIVQVAHPQWLRAERAYLTPTGASGPRRVAPGSTRVLSGQLELSNASPLEQQKVSRGMFVLAENEARARRDLVGVIAAHDLLCASALQNLKHQTDAGYRANDVVTRRLRVDNGLLRETKDPYNVAIDGEGFFMLSNGLLTRDGSFEMNREGQLVTHNGLQLMTPDGPLVIPADMSNIEIKGDGTVMGTRLNGEGKPEYVAEIALALVAEPAYLERSGTHLRQTVRSGAPRLGLPGKEGRGVVAQGYLESSNLSAIDQIKMLQALRNYAHLLGMPLADDYSP